MHHLPSVVSLPDTSPAIEIRDLVKTYGRVKAVVGMSFTVARGEIVGFLGPNGAGKSTTMRILTGYLPATSGHAAVCGISVAARPAEVKRQIGYMPENNPLPEDMRVTEYLQYRGRLKELPRPRLRARIDDVLRGRPVTVTQGERTVTGTATGIDNEGSLIVRLTTGRTERFRAGEVTLSKQAAPA